jgi:hypothetical protein
MKGRDPGILDAPSFRAPTGGGTVFAMGANAMPREERQIDRER